MQLVPRSDYDALKKTSSDEETAIKELLNKKVVENIRDYYHFIKNIKAKQPDVSIDFN